MAITMDWTATILAATGTTPAAGHPLDGIDLLPVIKGQRPPQERTFFWRIYDQDAVRQGKWKYLRNGEKRYLFDLTADEREQANFGTKQPDVLKRLAAEFDKWNQQMLPRPSSEK
jgi:arylsulfatase A-like enzyme